MPSRSPGAPEWRRLFAAGAPHPDLALLCLLCLLIGAETDPLLDREEIGRARRLAAGAREFDSYADGWPTRTGRRRTGRGVRRGASPPG